MVSDRAGVASEGSRRREKARTRGGARRCETRQKTSGLGLVAIQITPELVTSIAGLVGALGVAVKQMRDARSERRARRKHSRAIAKVARKADAADVADELELDDDGKP